MSNPTAWNPSYTVSFVVQNNSSINRIIKIFNTKVAPGGSIDVMKIPGVTEEDLRSALTKGYMKNLLQGGSLKVVSSTVNLSSPDPGQAAFLQSIGLSASSASPATATQAAWYIDPVNGLDTNTGLSGSPLKTNAKLASLLNGTTLMPPGATTNAQTFLPINYLNPCPSTDPLNLNVILGPGVTLQLIGTSGITSTPLTVTAVRSKVRSSNTPWGLTLSGTTPASLVGSRIFDSTTGNGYFWGMYDEGASVLRVSEPFTPPTVVAGSAYPQQIGNSLRFTPLNTDTFTVQTLPTLSVGSLIVTGLRDTTRPSPGGGNNALRPSIMFQDLNFIVGDPDVFSSAGVVVTFYGCLFSRGLNIGPSCVTNWANCCHCNILAGVPTAVYFQMTGGFGAWQGGCFIDGFPIIISSSIRFDLDVVFQSTALCAISGSRWVMGTWAAFNGIAGGPSNQNPTGDGLRVGNGAIVSFSTDLDSTNYAWGSGSTGAGIGMSGGANLSWQGSLASAPMSITGSTPGTNDFVFRGITGSGTVTSSYSVSAAGVISSAFTNSWANFFNVSDFNGTAHNPPTFSFIIPSGITV